jgi:hypothetical protein
VKFLVTHLPHIALGVILLGWVVWISARDSRRARSRRFPSTGGRDLLRLEDPRQPPIPHLSTVSPAIARRGLVLLVPLAATVGTGAVIYGLNISGQRPASGVIWLHAGMSGLVLVLVADKLARLRPLRHRLRLLDPLAAAGSVLLVFLLVPLLLTGIPLLVFPGSGSWIAYSHLIASVWWTLALFWHLRRYLTASLASVRGRHQQIALTMTPSGSPAHGCPARRGPDASGLDLADVGIAD